MDIYYKNIIRIRILDILEYLLRIYKIYLEY